MTNKILIVEDNPVNQMVARKMLQQLGYDSDVANNGLEALDLVQAYPYEIIFMDCQMPEMDGYEATIEIKRKLPPDQKVTIIALTAGGTPEDKEKCLFAGMDYYLLKPVSIEQLHSVIESSKHVSNGLLLGSPVDLEVINKICPSDQSFVKEIFKSYLEHSEGSVSEINHLVNQLSEIRKVQGKLNDLIDMSKEIGANQFVNASRELLKELYAVNKEFNSNKVRAFQQSYQELKNYLNTTIRD